jgi:hypothetical protein
MPEEPAYAILLLLRRLITENANRAGLVFLPLRYLDP